MKPFCTFLKIRPGKLYENGQYHCENVLAALSAARIIRMSRSNNTSSPHQVLHPPPHTRKLRFSQQTAIKDFTAKQ